MLSMHLARLCAPIQTTGARLELSSALLQRLSRQSPWVRLRRCQPLQSVKSIRCVQSTANREKARRPAYIYPERVNIYDSGIIPQMFIGCIRLTCITVFMVGTFLYAPLCLFDASTPGWVAPTAVVMSTAPLAMSIVAFGPYIHHIYVFLPSIARRSKDELMRFASKTPPDTRLLIKSQRIMPWPVTRGAAFSELKRLPPSYTRLANLEWEPWSVKRRNIRGIGGWLIRQYYGRFFVSRAQNKDRSVLPGVWDRMWEQLSIVGEEPIREKVPQVIQKRSTTKNKRLPERSTKPESGSSRQRA